jgi:putative addiction module component (TIGR02574 family)
MFPMSKRVRKILEDALTLALKERAQLAAELLASIDGEPDDEVEAAWAAEIERRARRALAGKSRNSGWEAVRTRIKRRLRSE